VIIVCDFLLERTLDYLNGKRLDPELPAELKDVYDADQYRKQQEYKKVMTGFPC